MKLPVELGHFFIFLSSSQKKSNFALQFFSRVFFIHFGFSLKYTDTEVVKSLAAFQESKAVGQDVNCVIIIEMEIIKMRI